MSAAIDLGDALADIATALRLPVLLAAVLGFLESHEPDLIACADALDVKPEALIRARQQLENA